MKAQTDTKSHGKIPQAVKNISQQMELFPYSSAILVYLQKASKIERLSIYGSLQTDYPQTVYLQSSEDKFVNSYSYSNDKSPQSLKSICKNRDYLQFVVHISDDLKTVVGISDTKNLSPLELAKKLLEVIDYSRSTVKLVFNFALLRANSNTKQLNQQINAFITNLADQIFNQIKHLKKNDLFRLTDLIVEGRTDFLFKVFQPQVPKQHVQIHQVQPKKLQILRFYKKAHIDLQKNEITPINTGRDSDQLGRGLYEPRVRPDTENIIRSVEQHLTPQGLKNKAALNMRLASQVIRLIYQGKIKKLEQNTIVNNIRQRLGIDGTKMHESILNNIKPIQSKQMQMLIQFERAVEKNFSDFTAKFSEQNLKIYKIINNVYYNSSKDIQTNRFKRKWVLQNKPKFIELLKAKLKNEKIQQKKNQIKQWIDLFTEQNLKIINKYQFNENDSFANKKVINIFQKFYNSDVLIRTKQNLARKIQLYNNPQINQIQQLQYKLENFRKINDQLQKLIKQNKGNSTEQILAKIKKLKKLITSKQKQLQNIEEIEIPRLKQQFINTNSSVWERFTSAISTQRTDTQQRKILYKKYPVFKKDNNIQAIENVLSAKTAINHAISQQQQKQLTFINKFQQLNEQFQIFKNLDGGDDYYSSRYYLETIEELSNDILQSSKTSQSQYACCELIKTIKKVKRQVLEVIQHESFRQHQQSFSFSQTNTIKAVCLMFPEKNQFQLNQIARGICFGLSHIYCVKMEKCNSTKMKGDQMFPLGAIQKMSKIKNRIDNSVVWDKLMNNYQKNKQILDSYVEAKDNLHNNTNSKEGDLQAQFKNIRNQCIELVGSEADFKKIQNGFNQNMNLSQFASLYKEINECTNKMKNVIVKILEVQKNQKDYKINSLEDMNITVENNFGFLDTLEQNFGYKIALNFEGTHLTQSSRHALYIYKINKDQYICYDPNYYEEFRVTKQRTKFLIRQSMILTCRNVKATIGTIQPAIKAQRQAFRLDLLQSNPSENDQPSNDKQFEVKYKEDSVNNKIYQEIVTFGESFEKIRDKMQNKGLFSQLSRYEKQVIPCTPYDLQFFKLLGQGTKVNNSRKRIVLQMEADEACKVAVENILKKDPKNTELVLNLDLGSQNNNKSYQYIQQKNQFRFEPVCNINPKQELEIVIVGHGGLQQDGTVSFGAKSAEDISAKIKEIIKGRTAKQLKIKLIGCRTAHQTMAKLVGGSLDEFANQLKITDPINVELVAYKENIRIGADGKPFYIDQDGLRVTSKMMEEENLKTKLRLRKVKGEVKVTGPTQKDERKIRQKYKKRLAKNEITQEDINRLESSIPKALSQQSVEEKIAKQYHAKQIMISVKGKIEEQLKKLPQQVQGQYKNKLVDYMNIQLAQNGKFNVHFVDPKTGESKPLEMNMNKQISRWHALISNIKLMNTNGMRVVSGCNTMLTVGFLIRGIIDIYGGSSKWSQMDAVDRIHFAFTSVQTLQGVTSLGMHAASGIKIIQQSSKFTKVIKLFESFGKVMPFVNLGLNTWNMVDLVKEFSHAKNGKGLIMTKIVITGLFVLLDIIEIGALFGFAPFIVLAAGPIGLIAGLALGLTLLIIDTIQAYFAEQEMIQGANHQCQKIIYSYLKPVITEKCIQIPQDQKRAQISFSSIIPIKYINLIERYCKIGDVLFNDYRKCEGVNYIDFIKSATEDDKKILEYSQGYITLYHNKNWNMKPKLNFNRQIPHIMILPSNPDLILHQRFNCIVTPPQAKDNTQTSEPVKETQQEKRSMKQQYDRLVQAYQISDNVNRFAPYFTQYPGVTALIGGPLLFFGLSEKKHSMVTALNFQKIQTTIEVILDQKTTTYMINPKSDDFKYLTYKIIGSNCKYGIAVSSQIRIILSSIFKNRKQNHPCNTWIINFSTAIKNSDIEILMQFDKHTQRQMRVLRISNTEIKLQFWDELVLTLKFALPSFPFTYITLHFPRNPKQFNECYVVDAELQMPLNCDIIVQLLRFTQRFKFKVDHKLMNCNWTQQDKSQILPCYIYEQKRYKSQSTIVLLVPRKLNQKITVVHDLLYISNGVLTKKKLPFQKCQISSDQNGNLFIKRNLNHFHSQQIQCQLWSQFQAHELCFSKITVKIQFQKQLVEIYTDMIAKIWDIFILPQKLEEKIKQLSQTTCDKYFNQFEIIVKIQDFASLHLVLQQKNGLWNISHAEKTVLSKYSKDQNPSLQFIEIKNQLSNQISTKKNSKASEDRSDYYYIINTKKQEESLSLLPKWFAEREINVCICFEQDFNSYNLLIDSLPLHSKIILTAMTTKNGPRSNLNVSLCTKMKSQKLDNTGGLRFTDCYDSQLLLKIDTFRNMHVTIENMLQQQSNEECISNYVDNEFPIHKTKRHNKQNQ